jgi:hypothetical protein
MANYSVEGKLGTGKTKFCVWQAQQALLQGRRVASNVDLNPWKLVPPKVAQAARYVRIPDKPRAFDLEALGHGNPDSYDEDRNGVLILDELATWLNARTFQDKDRAALIDWLVHARKHGWNVYFIVQHANAIDRQVREMLIEYQVTCRRLDKVKLPVIGGVLNSIFGGRVGYLPKMHLASARLGEGTTAIVAERWFYRGEDLHAAYDTRQVFRSDYPHGSHCWVSFEPVPPRRSLLRRIFNMPAPAPRPQCAPRPKLPMVAALEKLPPAERVKHWRRLEARGLLHAAPSFKA